MRCRTLYLQTVDVEIYSLFFCHFLMHYQWFAPKNMKQFPHLGDNISCPLLLEKRDRVKFKVFAGWFIMTPKNPTRGFGTGADHPLSVRTQKEALYLVVPYL